MKLQIIILLGSLGAGCRTRDDKVSDLLSQETSEALALTCKRYPPDDNPAEGMIDERDQLCNCLNQRSKVHFSSICGQSPKWEKVIFNKYKSRWPADFIAQSRDKNEACLEQLTYSAVGLFYFNLKTLCENPAIKSMVPFTTLETNAPIDSCWELTGMTQEGCFVAESCVGTTADLKYLPLNPPKLGHAPGPVTICHERIQKIHHTKDPDNQNLLYNKPFTIELCPDLHKRGSYGPQNCHGTAQAIIGEPLGNIPMDRVAYRSTADKNICGDLAARTLASKHPATSKSLALSPGGFLINMNHDPSCDPNNCGDAALYVDSCDAHKMDALTFLDGMCVNCWAKMLENAGMIPLNQNSTPADLQPGCLLTAADHSVTVLMQSQQFCYYYEATSPYGPPQLRVNTCSSLWQRFEKKWCPSVPLTYTLK